MNAATKTIRPVKALRAYVYGTMSGSMVTITLADGHWVVTYTGSRGHSVFTCEDWVTNHVTGCLQFFGYEAIVGTPVVSTSRAYLIEQVAR